VHFTVCILLPRDRRSVSAVFLSLVVRPSAGPSVCPSVRDVGVPRAYRLD